MPASPRAVSSPPCSMWKSSPPLVPTRESSPAVPVNTVMAFSPPAPRSEHEGGAAQAVVHVDLEVGHAVAVDIGLDHAGVAEAVIGLDQLPRSPGEGAHDVESLVAVLGGVGVDMVQVDGRAARVGDVVGGADQGGGG